MRILVVEDEPLVALGLKHGLAQLGYTVDVATSAEEAEGYVQIEEFDIALVDIGLPKADGFQFVRRLRASGKRLPILILTALDSMEDTVRGLDAGADDYLTKPYRLPEIAARIRALIRRSHDIAEACLRHNNLVLDTLSRTASIDGAVLDLTRREWAILELLLQASPAVISKDRLVHSLAGWDKDITPNAIEVHISRLRGKLSAGNIVIRTIRGIGYRVDAAEN
jgi:two-component system, OmpR family, response regulator QseB